jgi:hypothetical protein
MADDSNSPSAVSLGASGLSAASAGLDAYSSWLKGAGENASDQYRAERAEQAAQYAKLDAAQTGAAMSMRLSSALGNIDAMRAAANTDPRSPTGAAIRDTQENIGLSQKAIAVDNKMAQARQDESDAAYLQTAGKYALLGGDIGAASGIMKAVSSALPLVQAAAMAAL